MTEYLGSEEAEHGRESDPSTVGFGQSTSFIFEDPPASLWDPLPYFVFLHRLIEGGLGALRSGDQLLYLKFVRESFGRGRDTVSITMKELGRTTGLGKRAVEEGLARLIHEGLIRVLAKGHGHIATEYHVFRALAPAPSGKKPRKPSVETVLSQLTPEEQSKLLQMARTLEAEDRARFESEVREHFHALGLLPSPPMLHQAFLFKVLEATMFHTINDTHPHFFS
ncbi:MAG: hypothetical protein KC643_25060 [Nitrospira sp.]|nr:hypothetical protein [Nitrospira sp.]